MGSEKDQGQYDDTASLIKGSDAYDPPLRRPLLPAPWLRPVSYDG